MVRSGAAASLYVRLSRAAGESNLSRDGMVADLQELADRLGLDVVAQHVDDGISGAVRDRPEFTAWLNDARSGRATTLLAYHTDRLTREGVNAAALVLDVVEGKDPETGKVVSAPVRLVTYDGLDSERDADGFRWRFVIAAEVARSERERIKARNKRAQERLKASGRFSGGAIPYGTRVVSRDGGRYLEVQPDEAEHLREAAVRLIRGDSVRATVTYMNAQGWTTRRGLPWQRSSLRWTLLSEPSRDHVFDAATYRALVGRLSPNSTAPKDPGGRPSSALLRGLLICPCGRAMTTHSRRANGRAMRRYSCMANGAALPCEYRVTVAGDAADTFVEDAFLGRWGHLEYLEPRVMISGAEDLDAAETAVREAEAALLANLTPENLTTAQHAREHLGEVQARPVTRETILVATGKTVAEVWRESGVPERTDILRTALAGAIVVRPAREFPTTRGGARGGAQLNPGRFLIPWRGEDDPDYLAGQV